MDAAAAHALCRISLMNVWIFVEIMYINLIKIFSNISKTNADANSAFRKSDVQYIAFFEMLQHIIVRHDKILLSFAITIAIK